MRKLEESIREQKHKVKRLSDEANSVIKDLAQTNYDLETLFRYNELGVPCIDSSANVDLLKKKRRLETAMKKAIHKLDVEKTKLHELQEVDRASNSVSEEWRPVNVSDGLYAPYYEVSNKGNVRSYRKGKWGVQDKPKMLSPDDGVYRHVNLVGEDGSHRSHTIHSLVANAFLPNPHNYKYINHKDGNKKNNNVDNLEWCTHAQNMAHASKHGLMYSKPIREIATGKVFPSILEAARQKGCNPSRIYAHLDGYRSNKRGDSLYEYVV